MAVHSDVEHAAGPRVLNLAPLAMFEKDKNKNILLIMLVRPLFHWSFDRIMTLVELNTNVANNL